MITFLIISFFITPFILGRYYDLERLSFQKSDGFAPYVLPVYFKELNETLKMRIDSLSNYTFAINEIKCEDEKKFLFINGKSVTGCEARGTLYNITEKDFRYILAFKSDPPNDSLSANGSLGILMNQQENLYSIIYYLNRYYGKGTSNGTDPSNVFTVENEDYNIYNVSFIHTENNKALLGINEVAQKSFSEEDKCQIKDKEGYLSCEVSKVIINHKDIEESFQGIFSINEEFIYAPLNEGAKKIIDQYLSKISGAKCSNETNATFFEIYCKKFEIDYLPDMSFIFNKTRVTAIGENLFKEKNSTHLLFKIRQLNNEKNLGSKWIIGEPFIRNYDFIFDLSEETKYIIIVPNSKISLYLVIFVISAGVLILIVFLIMIYRTYANVEKKKNN